MLFEPPKDCAEKMLSEPNNCKVTLKPYLFKLRNILVVKKNKIKPKQILMEVLNFCFFAIGIQSKKVFTLKVSRA